MSTPNYLADPLFKDIVGSPSDDRRHEIRGAVITMIVLSSIAVVLRFAARQISKARAWWDDYIALIALLFTTGLNACILSGTNYGLGQHAQVSTIPRLIAAGKILLSSQVIYILATNAAKLSILVFYYRIFGHNRNFQLATAVGLTLIISWTIAGTCGFAFQCTPVSFFWNKALPGGVCMPQRGIWIGTGVASLLTDVFILCLPIPMIWNLQISRRQKIALSGVFLLGGFVCVTSILRLVTIQELNDHDVTWTLTTPSIWTSIECSMAVVSACLPTLRPLMGKLHAVAKRSTFGTFGGAATTNKSVTRVKRSQVEADCHSMRSLNRPAAADYALDDLPAESSGVRASAKAGPPPPDIA